MYADDQVMPVETAHQRGRINTTTTTTTATTTITTATSKTMDSTWKRSNRSQQRQSTLLKAKQENVKTPTTLASIHAKRTNRITSSEIITEVTGLMMTMIATVDRSNPSFRYQY
jgi:hypothetical protein